MMSFESRNRVPHGRALGALLYAMLFPLNALAQLEDDSSDAFSSDLSESDESSEVATEPEEEATESESDSAFAQAEGSLGFGSESSSASTDAEPTSEAEGERTTEEIAEAPVVPAGPAQLTLWQGLRSEKNRFGFDGAMEMDVAYADYRFSSETFGPETFHDFRGQFWLTPIMERRFGEDDEAFLRVSAELVAWLREEVERYNVNVFDAYAQVGVDDIVDVKVGRVTTWRIFQPGNGFDIFTLEDTGALKEPGIDGKQFYTFRYEGDFIWLRDTPGRAAVHIYPLKKFLPQDWSDLGIELTGEYGKKGLSNILGARATVIYDHKWLRLAGGTEVRELRKAATETSADGVICENCSRQYNKGYAGSVVVRPPYVVAGFNHAAARLFNYGSLGEPGDEASTDRRTQGGFIELHTGHILASTKDGPLPDWTADQRSEDIRKITVGYGRRRTENLIGNGDFERHDQQAAYLKYNLGFNQAFVKFVGSYAKGTLLDNTVAPSETPRYRKREGDMLTGRVRFAYYW